MKQLFLVIIVLMIIHFDSDVFSQSYASMYISGAAPQPVSGWTTLSGFTSNTPDQRTSDWNFASNTLTASGPSTGLFMVSFSISFSGSVTGQWQIGISINNNNPDSISIIRMINTGGDLGNASATGYVQITNGKTFNLKVLPPSNGNINVKYAQVTLARLSDIASYNNYAENGIYGNSNSLALGTGWVNLTNSSPGYTAEHLSGWSHSNGVLTATEISAGGIYLVSANFSLTGSSGLTFDFGVSRNDADPVNINGGRKISNINVDIGNVTITGIIQVANNDNIRLKVKASNSGNITVNYCHISLVKISGGLAVSENFPFASMYQMSSSPATQSLPQLVNTKLQGYSVDVTDLSYWQFSSNQFNPIGVSAGIYRVNYFLSYATDAGNNKIVFKVFRGSTDLPDLTISRSTSNPNDRGAAAGNGIIEIANATDSIKIIAYSDKAVNISLYRSRLTLSRIEQTSSIPLPVELSSFTAKVLKSGGVQLNWRTETEVSNYGFDIERASSSTTPVQDWMKIGFVEGHGNSNSPKDYSFTDENARYSKYSYRLKQIDTDGQFEYSKIIEVDAGNIPDGFVLEQNYPNPFNPYTTIKFALAETQKAELKIFDILGNEVIVLFDGIADGGKVYEVEFNVAQVSRPEITSGVYFYRLATESKVENRKMLLLK